MSAPGAGPATVRAVIIWRGFGFLAFLIVALAAVGAVGIGTAVSGADSPPPYFPGLGLILGGAGTFALGWWLNVVRPQQKAAQWTQERGAQLQQLVASGRFQAVPGMAPASHAEAEAQAHQMLAQESAVVAKRLRNVHTLFWIPMQWIGVVAAVIGVVVAISGLTG